MFPALITWTCPQCRKVHQQRMVGDIPIAIRCSMCGFTCGARFFKLEPPPKEDAAT